MMKHKPVNKPVNKTVAAAAMLTVVAAGLLTAWIIGIVVVLVDLTHGVIQ